MMTAARTTPAALSRPMPPLASVLFHMAQTVARWEERRQTRRALARLDAHLMRDIGMTPGAQSAECNKPFWRD
jgi:uncharacterized protein YjiS (DUF1127 family)